MVIAPELLSYYANIPISRLEEEVAHMVAAMQAATARQAAIDQQLIRPTAYDKIQPRTNYQALVYQQARQDEAYGKLYYEDMPLRYRGRTLRDAQEVTPILDGRTSDDSIRL